MNNMRQRNKKIYKEFLRNIFKRGTQVELAKKFGITKQRVKLILNNLVIQREKEADRYRKEMLLDTKYVIIEVKDEEQLKAVIHSMILDGFNHTEITYGLNIDKNKVTKIMRDIDIKNPNKLTLKIWGA